MFLLVYGRHVGAHPDVLQHVNLSLVPRVSHLIATRGR